LYISKQLCGLFYIVGILIWMVLELEITKTARRSIRQLLVLPSLMCNPAAGIADSLQLFEKLSSIKMAI